MNLFLGVEGFDLAALAAPLVVIALPCVGLISALAVLFKSVSWLRGGLGNVVSSLLLCSPWFLPAKLPASACPATPSTPTSTFRAGRSSATASREPPRPLIPKAPLVSPSPSPILKSPISSTGTGCNGLPHHPVSTVFLGGFGGIGDALCLVL